MLYTKNQIEKFVSNLIFVTQSFQGINIVSAQILAFGYTVVDTDLPHLTETESSYK